MLLLLLSCWIITGVMAEDPTATYYQLKNSTVCLTIRKPPLHNDVTWDKLENTGELIVVNGAINPDYQKKVVYSSGNHSLCINNLNDSDAGIYDVSVRNGFYKVSERHRVIVEAMVPRPEMRMSVHRSNLSDAGPCNITVNCSVQDAQLQTVCERHGCRTSRSFSKVNITIFTDNTTVVCSGSNHVSREEVSESIDMCFSKSNPEPKETSQPPFMMMMMMIIIIIAIIVFAVCVSLLAKRFSTACTHQQAQTSAAQLIQSQPVDTRSEPRASTSSSSQAEPSYENVDVAHHSQTHSPREELRSSESYTVDTVYSILQMPSATVPPGERDSSEDKKGHEDVQEAVSQDDALRSTEGYTLYSVLQKPKKVTSQHHQ